MKINSLLFFFVVIQTTGIVSSIQIGFRPARRLTLNDAFRDTLETKLIQTYEAIPTVYDKFLADFGTHYFDTAILGGYLYLKSVIKNDYVMQSDEQSLEVNLKASFAERVKATTDIDTSKKKVTESFRTNSEHRISYYGGQGIKVEPNDPTFMDKWVPEVIKNPWILGGTLKPIQDLIQNVTVKGEVEKAIKIRRARAYLQELKDAVAFGDLLISQNERNELNELERKLNSLKDNKEDMEDLVYYMDKLFKRIQHLKGMVFV